MKVLLATDGSEYSVSAAEFLVRLDFGPDDEILVVHVVSQIPYEDDYHAQVKQVIRRVAPRILRDTTDILKGVRAKVSSSEEQGYPDMTIIEKAVAANSDLIVMGASGIKGIPRVFLGSSTRSVVINSPKSVLVVKRIIKKRTGPLKVLFATDGSESSNRTAEVLSMMPFPAGSELTIVHCPWTAASEIPETLLYEINDSMKAGAARARATAMQESDELLARVRSGLQGRFERTGVISKIGDPTTEILNDEKALEADLIAVGCRGLRGVRGMIGSVSRRILDHSECSVLVGKA